MDLSSNIQNLHEPFNKFIKNRNESCFSVPIISKSSCDFDIIDVTRINFGNDETWLYDLPNNCEPAITNLNNWLHKTADEDFFPSCGLVQNISQTDFQKRIDTRTFTRPKKRFTRPSIEKYNEEVYGSNFETVNDKITSSDNIKSIRNEIRNEPSFGGSAINVVSEPIPTPSNPVNFDFSQPINSYYFENVLANAADVDSFQNMSPPSLVNSMCSSTFANLMESSFIKNDPVLREIRDTDFTETVLLQDSEPPMFQSITESCSSLNSDTPESFLKKVSYNGTFRKNSSSDYSKTDTMEMSNSSTLEFNITYDKSKETDLELQCLENEDEKIYEVNTESNFNGTYRRTPKSNNTFRKSNVKNTVLNSTFEMSPKDTILDQSSTHTFSKNTDLLPTVNSKESYSNNLTIIKDDTVEEMKKQLSETVEIRDLNRLSYCLDEENIPLDSCYTDNDELNRTVNMKRSSLGCSTGSADSLDRMSSLSNSSRESNKMLNMADLDAIVQMQERSLQQVILHQNRAKALRNSGKIILFHPLSKTNIYQILICLPLMNIKVLNPQFLRYHWTIILESL
ncbi:hypothetical protein NQ317_006829 [Molorchus minor]|uniref:Uncharacterized protein n=1 Tax=Molorchus minor TaxID=1323400 RepID=A0ABQ9K1P0_9CUCU|nr:hypothetical protein NQ317_006829 [Molorchus minor]